MAQGPDAPADFAVYVLGAGASHEGGVPLSAQILPAGYELLVAMAARANGTRGDYLDELSSVHLRSFQRVYDFIARVFQARPDATTLDLDAIPTLDELWALLEIAYESRATFGRGERPSATAEVRAALMAVMYHALVGCHVGYKEGGRQCVSFQRQQNPYGEFVRGLGPHDVIVALNYDTLLDQAVRANGRGLDYGTDVLSRHTSSADRVRMYKLHGSFNWLYCPTCNSIEDFGDRNVAHIPLESDESTARCPIDDTPREYIIIPPSLIKSYGNLHIQRIWDAAASALRSCTRLVFLGYAMGESDVHVRYLVKQATSLNPALAGTERRITAVNSSNEGLESYVRLFGTPRVQTLAMSFGEYVRQRMPRP